MGALVIFTVFVLVFFCDSSLFASMDTKNPFKSDESSGFGFFTCKLSEYANNRTSYFLRTEHELGHRYFLKKSYSVIKEEQPPVALGDNDVEKFFKSGIQQVTFVAHDHDLAQEFSERRTISAIPIILPLSNYDLQFSISFKTYLPDKAYSEYRTCGGRGALLLNKCFIKNICTKLCAFEYGWGHTEGATLSLETETFKPVFIKEVVMSLWHREISYTQVSHTHWHSFPLKENEKISVLVTNNKGKMRIFDVPLTKVIVSQSNRKSIVTNLQTQWMKRINTDSVETLSTFITDISSTPKPQEEGLESLMTDENFSTYKNQVVRFCEQKIEMLKNQNKKI